MSHINENGKSYLPVNWSTENLVLHDATLEDAPEIQEIYELSSYLGEWDGHPERIEGFIATCIEEGDLPPDGTREAFKIQCIRLKETSEAIGYVNYYHGYPDADTVWLATIIIKSEYKGKGFGREFISEFSVKAKENGFANLKLVVALKNWPAIRFWSRNGFDKIIKVVGDEVYQQDTFANMVLEKVL